MLDVAVIALRLVQYIAGSILMGSALFLLYTLPNRGSSVPWARPWLTGSAVVLAISAAAGLIAQTAVLAGSLDAALTAESMTAVLATSLAKAAVLRSAAAGLAAVILLICRPGRGLWVAAATLGTFAVATFAWMGHGAAAGTWLQLGGDLVHVLVAATWIGALVAFVALVRRTYQPNQLAQLHTALLRFSSIGVPLVAVLVLSGVINGWFLVGPDHLTGLLTTPYGQLLLAKLTAFALMLVLAAINRYHLTPALEARPGADSVTSLRRALRLEAGLGMVVLGLVAWLGTLEPPAVS